MRTYHVRYVHKVSPRDTDTATVALADTAFADRKTLAKALRDAKIMLSGCSIREMRTEANRVVVFPTCPGLSTYWHSIILTAEG